MVSHKKARNEDEVEDVSPFANLQKSAVLREARCFNDAQLDAQKCSNVITMILYLLGQGEHFYSQELTDVFFGVTKLFQSKDVHLRRLVYLIIKELNVGSDESLIVCACLSKDMTSKVSAFRGNAIKVLSIVMDPSMVGQLDRFLKQALVDTDPFIVSSTLIAGHRLFGTNPDVVKRWTSEIQEALNNKSSKMVQYHAMSLLHQIKKHDRLAMSKVVTALCKNPPRGVLAQVLLIRIIASLLKVNCPPNNPLLKFILDCLHNKNFVVVYEAAKTLCGMENLASQQVAPAIQMLQQFLPSPKPVQRFAAVKTLSQVVHRFPLLVSHCAKDLEYLINDPNRTTATLAITTLLKTGVESSIDHLMKSITGFINEVSEEHKVVLVDSIKALCLKFPHKYPTLLSFLAGFLTTGQGAAVFKNAVIDAILTIVDEIPETQDSGLEHFCEFIEDCEFPELSVKILHFLGKRGPQTANPAKYIRFIFNRIILETASVRAAAVSSLGSFGAAVPSLRENILVLLARCITDNDDEVRDRAVFFINLLGPGSETARNLLTYKPNCSFTDLELSLQVYLEKCQNDQKYADQSFSLARNLVRAKASEQVDTKEEKKSGLLDVVNQSVQESAAEKKNKYLELLNSIPELAELGEIFFSTDSIDLTEQESEYFVSCVKHIYPEHVVLQFNVQNGMEGQQLENVTVDVEGEEEGWEAEFSIPEALLAYQANGVTFVAIARDEDSFNSGALQCTLKFTAKDVDASGEVDEDGDEDEYPLEEIDIQESDFMRPAGMMGIVQFRKMWEQMGDAKEVVQKFGLGMDNLQEAVSAVIDLLGMRACENSGFVPEGVTSHAINMAGMFFGGTDVLSRAGFMLDSKHGVQLKIAVRSSNAELNNLLVQSIQ